MRENNVHRLTFGRSDHVSVSTPSLCEPVQLELFDHDYGPVSAISYLDIEVLDQDRLIRSLTMKSVRTIIDLRCVPVFPKPRFDHRYLMSYLYERSVNYIECAMIAMASSEREASGDSLTRWFSRGHQDGVTACIIDDVAVRDGVVASFRKRMAKSNDRFVELHPRALI
jgi:hypothetical protein